MIDNDNDEPFMVMTFSANGDGVACPGCGSQLLHHDRIIVRSRTAEDKAGIEVIIDKGTVKLRTLGDEQSVGIVQPSDRGFRGRRDDFSVEFWCEECHQAYELSVMQHKGVTLPGVVHLGRSSMIDKLL